MALASPGITWLGHRSAATRELAVQIDASYLHMLPGAEPLEWWTRLSKMITIRDDAEVVKLVVDMEDLGTFKRKVGPRIAQAPAKMTHILMPRASWYRDRNIPIADLKYDNFEGWPDRLSAILLASRRTPGMIFAELLFAAATKTKTLQGIPLIGTGHKCNFGDARVAATFDNLVTGNSASATPGTMDANGWEYGQEVMFARPGPDGVYGLDQEVHVVLGGTKMKKKFKRLFKRVVVLEDSAAKDAAAGVTNIHLDEGVTAICSSWLDRHPWKVANPTLDQWWSFSETTMARAFGLMQSALRVDIFDEGSEHARLNEHILIKADMDANGGAAFPQVITEHRGA